MAAGAEMIEFHIRLWDTSPENADYGVARHPAEAEEYVGNIRLAERIVGTDRPGMQACEQPMLRYRV